MRNGKKLTDVFAFDLVVLDKNYLPTTDERLCILIEHFFLSAGTVE